MQRNTTSDDGLELWPDSASAANIGIMLFRKGAGKLAKVWISLIRSMPQPCYGYNLNGTTIP